MELHLQTLFNRIHQQFGSGPGLGLGSEACLMNADGISPNSIRSFYKAAAALYRTNPWRRLLPNHLFGIRVGKDSDWSGKKQPFPCLHFIGGDRGDTAIYMYRSTSDARKMSGARETEKIPNVEVLRITYQSEELLFSGNKKMIKLLSLEPSGDEVYPVIDVERIMSPGKVGFRNASMEEVRFACGAIAAMGLVHPLLEEDTGGSKWPKSVGFEALIETVDVEWEKEMAINQRSVAVTVSHPPQQSYDERGSSSNSTPTKYADAYALTQSTL